jgi:hypothetical protein
MDKLLTKTKTKKPKKIENRDESTYNRRGNLGTSIAIGISKFSKNNQVTITRRNTASIAHLENVGITVSSDNTQH